MKIRNILIGALMLSSTIGAFNANAAGSNKMPASSKMILRVAKDISKSPEKILSNGENSHPFSYVNNILNVELLIKVNSESAVREIQDLGCKIVTHAGDIYAVKVPYHKVDLLLELGSVSRAEVSKTHKFKMDKSKKAINAEQVTVTNNLTPTNIIGGEGVIVGVFDTGIDPTHPDFFDANGKTRILKLWDMSSKSSSGAPEGYNWGKEYTKADIDNDISSVAAIDAQGHGTHVAGTAAGGGMVDANFRGIAYGSDLIIVKGVRDDGEDTGFTDADLIAGCSYIISEAKKLNKPVVINLSLGDVVGSHDGKDLLALALTSMVERGAIIVAAAGNEGATPMHAGGAVAANSRVEFPVLTYANLCDYVPCPKDPNYLVTGGDVWFDEGTIDSVYIMAYSFSYNGVSFIKSIACPVGGELANYVMKNDDGDTLGIIDYSWTSPNIQTGLGGNIAALINNGGSTTINNASYIWSIGIKTKNAGNIDMWAGIPIQKQMQMKTVYGTPFYSDGLMTCGSPGNGDSIVCVGAFNTKNEWTDIDGGNQSYPYWEIGDAASFSSRGPSRDRRMLPTISAPGQMIFSTKSKDYIASNEDILDGGKYVGMQGTSMASPHVCGAVALMLQVGPRLSYSEVVEVLKNTATLDEYTGTEANNTFGYGKLNLQAAINYMLAHNTDVKYVMAKDVKVYPNPAQSYVNLELNSNLDNAELRLFNSNGDEIKGNFSYQLLAGEANSIIKIDVSHLPAGVYNVDCTNSKAKFRFVVSGK